MLVSADENNVPKDTPTTNCGLVYLSKLRGIEELGMSNFEDKERAVNETYLRVIRNNVGRIRVREGKRLVM